MKYISTRGKSPILTFEEVLLAGLASDGGLYVPETWPFFEKKDLINLAGLSYPELAVQVMLPFVDGMLTLNELSSMISASYECFDHAAVAPLRHLRCNEWLCELFHGPTLSFKDYALQFLGHLFNHVLRLYSKRAVIICATSGDTGSAAVAAFCNCSAVDVFVLHPYERISLIQRRQMTTTEANNIHNIAVIGTFDDCQAIVKGLFSDISFSRSMNLVPVNSINWVRIMAQTVYYFWSTLAIGGSCRRPVVFAVPTGNFGNIFSGYVARVMGLPVKQLIISSNSNDILVRFLATGTMEKQPVISTLSPSMDIQISSNFERLLFEMYDRNGSMVGQLMEKFSRTGTFSVTYNTLERISTLFRGFAVSDSDIKITIAKVYSDTGELIDPHTATGMAAAYADMSLVGLPLVVLSTAHPSKFPLAVQEATGQRPELPPHLVSLLTRDELFTVSQASLDTVKEYIYAHTRR